MTEFLLAYRRIKEDGLDRNSLRLAAFPSARFSESPKETDSAKQFVEHWEAWQQEFQAKIKEDLGLVVKVGEPSYGRISKEVRTYSFSEWVEFSSVNEELLKIGSFMRSWPHDTLDREPDDETLQRWVDDVRAATSKPEVILDHARLHWERGAYARAKRLFQWAAVGQDPEGHPEALREALSRDFGVRLNPIRDAVIQDMSQSQ